MSEPFSQQPTLRHFIDAAVARGCQEKRLQGPEGVGEIHYLIGLNGVLYPLSNMDENERLTPTESASLRRVLGIG